MAKVITDNQHYADIAAAIRTKNETEMLYKPSEMAPAILAIQGGVELNFEVVGGETEPVDPADNTIWVNTHEEITSWVFSATEPENPETGMVWIFVNTSSPVKFNALKDNGILVYPANAKQYDGATWTEKPVKSYQDGTWVDWIRYLFNYGKQDYTWKVRGWKHSASSHIATAPTVTNNSDGSVTLTLSVTSGLVGGGYELQENVDFTEAHKVTLEYDLTKSGSHTLYLLIIPLNSTYFTSEAVASASAWETVTNKTLEVDVSSISGKYSVGVALYCNASNGAGTGILTIKRIALE